MQLDLVDGVAPPDELALEEATTMVVTFFGFDGTTGLVFDAFFVGVNAFFTPPVPPASPVPREAPPAPLRLGRRLGRRLVMDQGRRGRGLGWAPADFLGDRARDVMVDVVVAEVAALDPFLDTDENVTRLGPPGFESVHPMLDLDLMDLL